VERTQSIKSIQKANYEEYIVLSVIMTYKGEVLNMKTLLILLLLTSNAFAWDWNSSASNWNNSSSNWNNSESNWKNSSSNWENNASNANRSNSIFNTEGQSIGYTVPKEDGGTNIFSNDGKRIGYTPAD
jgi:heme/copper-type cytochrome/quinol oxidase subunit 1